MSDEHSDDLTFSVDDTRTSYDAVASEYAATIAGELANKPFDRAFLDHFGDELAGRGRVVELGCGPGHVAAYLHGRGVDVSGLDLSAGMIAQARRMFPAITFVVGDMLALLYGDASLAGLLAFYSIIHFDDQQLVRCFAEMARVLRPGGLAALAFHVGDERFHRDEAWGQPVSLDYRLLPTELVTAGLQAAGFDIVAAQERPPYAPEVEYQSRRAYIVAARQAPEV